MRIIIAGGSGFIGSYLKERFEELEYTVRTISRSGKDVSWSENALIKALNETDVLINLSGKSINSRFTAKNKQEILRSRIETTRALNSAVLKSKSAPAIWINASAIGIYEHTFGNDVLDEYSNRFSNDFLAEVVSKWEDEFFKIQTKETKKIALRTSVVLGNSGGAFSRLKLLTKTGLGGKQGNGNQVISWVHVEDYFRIILFVIENAANLEIVNVASPNPVLNEEFMHKLRKSVGMPIGIPAPAWLLKIASFFIGVDASLILDSSNVQSEVLRKNGFEFKFPSVESAFQNLK